MKIVLLREKDKMIKTIAIIILGLIALSCERKPKEVEHKFIISEKGDTISNTRYIKGKLDLDMIRIDTTMWRSKKYTLEGKLISIDTIIIRNNKAKDSFLVGWRWIDLNTDTLYKSYKGQNRELSREYFRVGNKSVINQEKMYKDKQLVYEESQFYKLYKENNNSYRLQIYPADVDPQIVDIYLCLSDNIKENFDNVESLKAFDTIKAILGKGVYWDIPKEQKELKGFVNIWRKSDKGEYLQKKIYINKKLE